MAFVDGGQPQRPGGEAVGHGALARLAELMTALVRTSTRTPARSG
ncbi:hypothetical protein SAFG77S_08129 [Streptomyces afghaniensis]